MVSTFHFKSLNVHRLEIVKRETVLLPPECIANGGKWNYALASPAEMHVYEEHRQQQMVEFGGNEVQPDGC